MGELILDLGRVEARDRSKSWQTAIKDNYLDLDIKFRSPFDPGGMIVQARAGSITLGGISSVAQAHERSQSTIDDNVDHLLGVMQFRGQMRLSQHGRESHLRPGHLLILDAGRPYHAEFPEDYQILVIKIPRVLFSSAFHSRQEFINVSVDEGHGSMVIVDYFRQLAKEFESKSLEQQTRMSSHGVGMLMSTLLSGTR